jgi:hypothetical protein
MIMFFDDFPRGTQWRPQEISEGMAVTAEKRSSTPIRDDATPFYNVFAGTK